MFICFMRASLCDCRHVYGETILFYLVKCLLIQTKVTIYYSVIEVFSVIVMKHT